MSSSYISLPTELPEDDLAKRQEALFLKVNSLEGSLYSLGAAVSECRKELNGIRDALHILQSVNRRKRKVSR